MLSRAKLRAMTTNLPAHVFPVELHHAYRLLNTGASVLISSAHANQRDVMACAWNMPLDFQPAKVAVCIDKATYTRQLIDASGTLAINLPCAAQADLVATVGHISGRDVPGHDKFGAFNIAYFQGALVNAPLVAGCVGWLECRVLPEPHLQQAHDLFIAEVLTAWADERAFAHGKYLPLEATPPEWRTLHHLGGGHFVVPGTQVNGRTIALSHPDHGKAPNT
jgi:flavin reductase (DIM6/NTAB) family NADH-FMN oxidoreductase RutF